MINAEASRPLHPTEMAEMLKKQYPQATTVLIFTANDQGHGYTHIGDERELKKQLFRLLADLL